MRYPNFSFSFVFSLTVVCVIGLTMRANAVGSSHRGGLKKGDPVGAFRVVKIGGATGDGVEPGDDVCYRCRYGSSPLVMVFSRQTGSRTIELAQMLDTAISENEAFKLRGLFTLIGDDFATLKQQAQGFADQSAVQRLPIVVADDFENGPRDFQISPDDEVTIVMAVDSQVVARHVYAADSIDIVAVKRVVAMMLN